MQIFHQESEGEIQRTVRGPGPTISILTGPSGSGKTTLLRRLARDRRVLWFRGSDLPAPLLARQHVDRLALEDADPPAVTDGAGPTAPTAEGDRGWDAYRAALLEHLAGETGGTLVVWDRADALLRDRRWREMLDRVWAELRAHARGVHLLLAARDAATAGLLELTRAPGVRGARVDLAPLGLREATAGFEGWSALDRLVAYGLLGGEPRLWDLLDPGVRLSTNLGRLLLEPGGTLRDFAATRFPVPGRNPGRALALVSALASGAEEWGELRERSRVFRTSSELGPYMKALQEAGLVEARRSLDAAPEGRHTRYGLASPYLAFWTSAVARQLPDLDAGASPKVVWKERIRPVVPDLVSRRLPGILADHLKRHGAERLRAPARETGGLWGEGYDLPVAGTLSSGAAFYGSTSWDAPGPDALQRLADQVRETRYGYGRQIRFHLLFVVQRVAHELERTVARGATTLLFRPGDLVAPS